MFKYHGELGTKLVGDSTLVEVNPHLTYRRDHVRFPSGREGEYTLIHDSYAAVAIAALRKHDDEPSVFMVWQERYPSQTAGWEIPAGRPEPDDEDPLKTAEREALEEAGITAEHWHELPPQVENVGRGDSRSRLFVAAGITVVRANVQYDEGIDPDRASWIPFSEIDRLTLDGDITSGHTLASLRITEAFLRMNANHPITQLVT